MNLYRIEERDGETVTWFREYRDKHSARVAFDTNVKYRVLTNRRLVLLGPDRTKRGA